jgi:hypothetical protein
MESPQESGVGVDIYELLRVGPVADVRHVVATGSPSRPLKTML